MQIVRTKEAVEQRLVDKAAAAQKYNMPAENAPLPKKKAKLPAAAAVVMVMEVPCLTRTVVKKSLGSCKVF